jgi:CHAP domain-containing protein
MPRTSRLAAAAISLAAVVSLSPATGHAQAAIRTATDPIAPWGTLLVPGSAWAGGWAAKGDLSVYSNGDGNTDQSVPTGDAYECVEFVQRWANIRYGAPPVWHGNAKDLWVRGPQLPIPFNQLPNGGPTPPQFGDIVVWGPTATAIYGHTAVVAAVRPGEVDVVEQNWGNHPDSGRTTLPIQGTTMPPRDGLPVLGWLRSALETEGYWMLGGDGGVFPYGTSGGYGSTGNTKLNQPIVGMAATPDGLGYWLVAGDGGIFPFGGAGGYGSTGNLRLNKPIVGMASTPSGHGYWLVASDGGIFPFGDAGGYGSTGNLRLNKPIVGMASSPDGHGYWLVASDGGVFPFGDAGGYGSTGNIRLNQPIVGMAASATGHGYWLVARDGGIFPFGDAPGYGSTGGLTLASPIVGITRTAAADGYWLTAADGSIYPFGTAEPLGALTGAHLNAAIIGIAANPARPATPAT